MQPLGVKFSQNITDNSTSQETQPDILNQRTECNELSTARLPDVERPNSSDPTNESPHQMNILSLSRIGAPLADIHNGMLCAHGNYALGSTNVQSYFLESYEQANIPIEDRPQYPMTRVLQASEHDNRYSPTSCERGMIGFSSTTGLWHISPIVRFDFIEGPANVTNFVNFNQPIYATSQPDGGEIAQPQNYTPCNCQRDAEPAETRLLSQEVLSLSHSETVDTNSFGIAPSILPYDVNGTLQSTGQSTSRTSPVVALERSGSEFLIDAHSIDESQCANQNSEPLSLQNQSETGHIFQLRNLNGNSGLQLQSLRRLTAVSDTSIHCLATNLIGLSSDEDFLFGDNALGHGNILGGLDDNHHSRSSLRLMNAQPSQSTGNGEGRHSERRRMHQPIARRGRPKSSVRRNIRPSARSPSPSPPKYRDRIGHHWHNPLVEEFSKRFTHDRHTERNDLRRQENNSILSSNSDICVLHDLNEEDKMKWLKRHGARMWNSRKTDKPLCQYFVRGLRKGRCKKGITCHLAHVTADAQCVRCHSQLNEDSCGPHSIAECPKSCFPTNLEGETRTGICSNFLNGRCEYGNQCCLRHTDSSLRCLLCQKRISTTDHSDSCEELKRIKNELEESKGVTCAICYREFKVNLPQITLKPNSDGQFVMVDRPSSSKKDIDANETFDTLGMLPTCFHPFCMACILSWRQGFHRIREPQARLSVTLTWDEQQQRQRRNIETIQSTDDFKFKCPVCRCNAPFIVPVGRFIRDSDRRQSEIEKYLKRLKGIRCHFFSNQKGQFCNVGNYCFFKHSVRRSYRNLMRHHSDRYDLRDEEYQV